MNTDQLTTVLRVACLTEDRDGDEQRAMLDLAMHIDSERGAFRLSNRRPRAPECVVLVRSSYEPSEGRRVDLTAAQREQYDRLLAKWQTCGKCKHPMGAHYDGDACPTTPSDLAWLAESGL